MPMFGPPKQSEATDSEVAEITELLIRVQEILEDRSKNYAPTTVINVLLNLGARYAAASKWPVRNFLKICGATYKAQKAVVEGMEKEKQAKETDAKN
jgi:hypothetical protein